jgi:hypothetical protein
MGSAPDLRPGPGRARSIYPFMQPDGRRQRYWIVISLPAAIGDEHAVPVAS